LAKKKKEKGTGRKGKGRGKEKLLTNTSWTGFKGSCGINRGK